ncbi:MULTISPECIES: LysE family translocator [unclassified Leptolyngbya]|uniref:LysE family translocator n=1 Tax=unclassified Leptolyngbya TaxID=2650499 RepID=UPI0016884D7E|nr:MULTISPECIES: LysE family translocator [unclassified Leptolyngbya]MBD1911064.1 LysE family translocator [Leptolyngbya sp. FACHB-8]MBD2158270.1 LysE family translocator [Leptolyngbya sp. FACHB-16]
MPIPDSDKLLIFMLASLSLAVLPGPVVMYIIARSISQGRRAGVVSAMGAAVGSLAHVAAAALGISALMVSSALAFQAVKYLGAIYLIYLGIRKLLDKTSDHQALTLTSESLRRIFLQALLVNVFNPKLALFFLAFLPQFVELEKGGAIAQVLILGCIFILIASMSDTLYGLVAGSIGSYLKGNQKFWRLQRYFAGGTFISLGLVTAGMDVHPE